MCRKVMKMDDIHHIETRKCLCPAAHLSSRKQKRIKTTVVQQSQTAKILTMNGETAEEFRRLQTGINHDKVVRQ